MAITFELPIDIEENLRSAFGNLNSVAKEAALVELYRRDTISAYELSRSLGISRLETEAVLKNHGVTEDLPTASEIQEDVANLRRLLQKT